MLGRKWIQILVMSAIIAFAGARLTQSVELHAQIVPPLSPCSCTLVTDTFSPNGGFVSGWGTASTTLACASIASPAVCRVVGTATWIPSGGNAVVGRWESPRGTLIKVFNAKVIWNSPSVNTSSACPTSPGPLMQWVMKIIGKVQPSLDFEMAWTCDGV